MSRDPKSPLLKKHAMDALLESMTTDSYDSLGGHRRGESSPEQKGTEFTLNGEGFSGSPAIIPPDDLKPPSGVEDAEFFKESQPRTGAVLHRSPSNKAHTDRCTEIAKAHPDWDASKVKAQATLVGLGVKPLESVLADLGVEKESREITPVEDDKATHEFVKEAPFKKYTHEEVDYESPSRHEGQTCAGCTMFLPPNGCTGVQSPIKAGDWCNEFEAKKKTAATKTLYHITPTDKVPSIKAKGILPLQTSNWVKGDEEGERYGEGEIFAMDNVEDAVRWAAKMDWEFNQQMGSGKISIVVFTPGAEKWKRDTSDPISQAANKGRWLKAIGSVKPEQITNSHVLTPEMVKSVVQGKGVKLSKSWVEEDPLKPYLKEPIRRPKTVNQGSPLPDLEYQLSTGIPTSRRPSMEEQENAMSGDEAEFEKEADVPTKSYGMGTPIGGTDNPDAGASDEPEELQDPAELSLNMTSSLDRLPMAFAARRIASMGDDIGWFYKSARPTEQKIELLQKQFKLTPEQIELCIQADPTEKDFVAVIAKWLGRGLVKLPEDTPKIKQQLDVFNKLKKSPKFEGNKDIQSYTPDALYETVEHNQENLSKKEKTRQEVKKGAEIIVQDGDLTIYKVTSTEAHMELSGGTNWCTAHNRYSSQYLSQGPAYIFFKGGTAFAQLHPPSDQLMDRTDVCMVTDVSDDANVTVAKFIDDPTALRGLQLLAKKAPDVEAWLKENISDPATLIEILGKKKEEEAQKGTESRTMAVQHALASGQPLPPEEEEFLPKRVSLDLLMRYGKKFHAGQRWKPLEKAILSSKERERQITDYALEFFKGRWPQGELKLLKKAFEADRGGWHVWRFQAQSTMGAAIDYAQRVIKGRWTEFETAMHHAPKNSTTSWGAAEYALEVLKTAWRNTPGIQPLPDGTFHEENLIATVTKNEHRYAQKFFPNVLWEEFQKIAPEVGLDESEFRPDKDLWIVQKWSDLASCVRNIGNSDADDAMDYALDEEKAPDQDLPSEEEMVNEVVKALSYNAMRRIGESLEQEEAYALRQWEDQQNRYGNLYSGKLDFTDESQLKSILLMMEQYAPECSVWKNIREAFRQGAITQYEGDQVEKLHYELVDGIKERGDDRLYTELRFGSDFAESFGYEWKVGPVYEVIDRWGASRMLDDGAKDISGGQIEIWIDSEPNDNEERLEGPELMEKWYTEGMQQEKDPRQMQLQFRSSLLKKKALIQMNESPSMLPPRDDIKGHMDQQEQDLLTKDLRQGVVEPLNPKKKKRQQIDPRINPHGVAASDEQEEKSEDTDDKPENPFADIDPDVMGEKRRALPRIKRRNGPRQLISPNDRARKGSEKTAEEYSQQDWEQDEQSQYFLDQVEEASDEAKRHFMQEPYLKQIAQDDGIGMDELWGKMGDEYTAEFYGTPYKRVQDFTDQTAPKDEEESKNAAAEKSEVRIRFKGKEEVLPTYKPEEIMEAIRHAEFLSMANPGFPVVFILDEAGIISEDTYINGNWVGPTVEKFAFQAAR